MVRPPLVGQASSSSSSSSNESRQSLSSETEKIQDYKDSSPLARIPVERCPESNDNKDDFYVDFPSRLSIHYMSNREDYINAKPPEGSSDQSLISTAEPSDCCPRISSPASSVTSGRRLEWDSGADVGYQPNYLENIQRPEIMLSTIERLAIVQGTNALLTRSDPEGTTEPSTQPVFKKLNKNNTGLPNAQSTPLSSNPQIQLGTSDMFSPITQTYNKSFSEQVSRENNSRSHRPNKYPLFPEINLNTNEKCLGNPTNFESDGKFVEGFSESSTNSTNNSPKKNILSPEKPHNPLNIPTNEIQISSKKNEIHSFINTQKLSSSMENIRELDKVIVTTITQPNTLPRSLSQNNVLFDNVETYSHREKQHILSNNLHEYPIMKNKSASSSSVATVVNKNNNDSPLHLPKASETIKKFVMAKEPLQSCPESLKYNELKSNYFEKNNSEQSDSKIEKSDIISEQCHKGVQCRGAHKRLTEASKIHVLGGQTNVSDIRPHHYTVDNNQYQESTLDSIESSLKSRGFSTDRQCSMVAEDRVNSFEYLPGYVYENEKQQSIQSTSSTSCPNNDNLWNSDDSISLSRDINRGVEIIKDVVRNKSANSNEVKKKVIQLVVDKLINTNYSEEDLKSVNINENMPWVPPIIKSKNVKVRNQDKSKVPGEMSSLTDVSTTNTSSECFKPKPPGILRDIGGSEFCLMDKCIGTGVSLTSTSRSGNLSIQTHASRHSSTQTNASVGLRGASIPQASSEQIQEHVGWSSSSNSLKYERRNWQEPITKAEQLYEQKRKRQIENVKEQNRNEKVIQFLDLEKKTQLMRIDIEMQHLNNLRQLLSKTEKLKENMNVLKNNRGRTMKSPVIENVIPDRTDSPVKVFHKNTKSYSHTKKSSLKQYSPSLLSWLNKAKSSQAIDNDWSSHHYLSEDLRSQMKNMRIGNDMDKKYPKIATMIGKRQTSLNTKTEESSSNQKLPLEKNFPNMLKENPNSVITEESTSASTFNFRRKNLMSSVGIQTSKSEELGSSFKRKENKSCKCHIKCDCCKENRCKQPVGYFITFLPESKSKQEIAERPILKERAIVGSSSDTTEKSSDTTRYYHRLEKKSQETCYNTEDKQNSTEYHTVFEHHPNTLQEYLERNRPDYIHHANDRRQCITELAYLRELRDQSKRRLVSLGVLAVPNELPPPPLAVKRVFTQKKMRQQTERKYKQLAEVKNRKQDEKRKEAYRTNRLMAEVFTKKLQKRVLKGETNLSNSVSVISNL